MLYHSGLVCSNWGALIVCAEGLPHSVPGTGAGESKGGAGDEEQPAAPEGEEAHGDGQTGGHHSVTYCYYGKSEPHCGLNSV